MNQNTDRQRVWITPGFTFLSGNWTADIAKQRHAFAIYEVQLLDITIYKFFISFIITSIAYLGVD